MNQAEAGSITYVFSGTVTNVANAPHVSGSPFNTSQTMSGQMTVSDVTLNNSPYQIQSLTLSIGGYQLSGTGSCSVAFNNNSGLNPPSIIDRFYGYGQVSGAGGGWLYPIVFHNGSRGPQSLFNSTALPTTVPSISSCNVKNEWRMNFPAGR